MDATAVFSSIVPQAVSLQPYAILNLGQVLGAVQRPGLLGIVSRPIKIGRRNLWR